MCIYVPVEKLWILCRLLNRQIEFPARELKLGYIYLLVYTVYSHSQHTSCKSLMVKGCDFQHDAPQIDLGNSLKKAVVIGNIITVRLQLFKLHRCMPWHCVIH